MRAESIFRALFLLGLVAAFAGCAKPPPDVDAARGQAVDRQVGRDIADQLACNKKKGDCADWHRLRIDAPGTLELEGRAIASDNLNPSFTMMLEDGFGNALRKAEGIGIEPRRLMAQIDAGYYLVGVRAPEGSEAFPYAVAVRFRKRVAPAPPPPPPVVEQPVAIPEPRFTRVPAEVLEVDGRMAAPTGVLIDVGRQRGARRGLRGELVDGDRFVGEIEIEVVYDEGSRARISGALQAPITPSVRAILLFPTDEAPDASGAPAGGAGATSP